MRRSSGIFALGILLLTVLGLGAPIARATTVVVPDDAATIQGGLELADTVLVRSGVYPDSFSIHNFWPDDRPRAVIRYPGSPSRPVVGPASLEQDYPAYTTLSGIECTRLVKLNFFAPGCIMVIDSCVVDSGFAVASGKLEDALLTISHSVVHGGFSGLIENLTLECDSLIDGQIGITGEGPVTATDCFFSQSGIGSLSTGGVVATRCRFEGCNRGILAQEGTLTATSCTFVNCGTGIDAYYDLGVIDSCTFLGCGWGISAGSGKGAITHNQVLGAMHVGIDAYVGHIENNVVAHCGEGGIRFDPGSEESTLRGNTCYDNGGWGFKMMEGSNAVTNNIGYRNRGYGFDGRNAPAATLGCNDWFANDSSAVIGVTPAPQDLAVDPQFCDVAHDDVHLAVTSPLLNAPGCGLVGALGQGCEAVIGVPIQVAPATSGLRSITPNPAIGDVHIEFDLARDGWVRLEVLDVQGRLVAVLANGRWQAGQHTVNWSRVRATAPGVYFVRYRFANGSAIRRLVRIS